MTPMSVLNKIASASDRRDETPNIELAQEIAKKKDASSIEELVHQLHSKDKRIQSDCIKVLYEIGGIDPLLIAPFKQTFLDLLVSRNNRLQWGAMTALNVIAKVEPDWVFASLPGILLAMESGSVITRDNGMFILIGLLQHSNYSDDAFSLLQEQLQKSPENQLPMYAESCWSYTTEKQGKALRQLLQVRMSELTKATARKRLEKVIRKIESRG